MKLMSACNISTVLDAVLLLPSPCCLTTCAAWEKPAECIEMVVWSRWFPTGNSDWSPVPDNLQQVSHERKVWRCIIISSFEAVYIFVNVNPFTMWYSKQGVDKTLHISAANTAFGKGVFKLYFRGLWFSNTSLKERKMLCGSNYRENANWYTFTKWIPINF